MATRLPETSEEGAIFGSADVAKQWQSRKAQRDSVNGQANEMMLDLANLRAGSRVLDVAAGTGEQTLLAARRVGPTGYVLATDLSASMLNLAAESIRDAGLTNVETRIMNAENIDLEADSFDAVMCRQGLMLFPDPVVTELVDELLQDGKINGLNSHIKALVGMRRVAKPASKVVALVWSSAEKNPFQGIPLSIVRRIGNMPSPAPGQAGMFALGDPTILEGIFRTAGFVDIAIHKAPLQRRFASTAPSVNRRGKKSSYSCVSLRGRKV